MPLEVISKLVRHENPTVTQQVYLHLRPEMVDAAAAGPDDLFAETGT